MSDHTILILLQGIVIGLPLLGFTLGLALNRTPPAPKEEG